MKFKIIAYTLSVPFVWLTLLFTKYYAPNFFISNILTSSILIGLFIGSLLVRIIIENKYLTDLSIEKNLIKLTYLTSFGQIKKTTILMDSVTDIKIKKKFFLIRDFGAVKLFQKNAESTFSIYNDSIRQTIDILLQNISKK